jgi:polyisoprenyl-teichoic acid--peptidoglycan teichoic acid transferase
MTTNTTRPYRRFRVHSGSASGGIEDLRRMTEGEVARAGGPARGAVVAPLRPERVGASPPPPPPPPRTPRAPGADARPPRRRTTHWWSVRGIGPLGWAIRVVVLLVAVFVIWGVAGYLALSDAVSSSNARITPAARKALTPMSGMMLTTPTNILFIGSDARPGEGQSRSDTMMIMRVDPNSGKIKYLSIPRDTLIDSTSCPSCGSYVQNQKINAAYFFQGEPGAIHTVEKFTGLPVNHIVIVSFDGLSQVVNDLGGVTVNNPFALKSCAYPGGITVSFRKGMITLNGTTALQYVRVRHCDSDIQREERQQAFLSALKSKIVTPGDIWQAPWNAASLVRALSTDMSATDLAQLGWLEMNLSQSKKDRYVLPGTPQYINGGAYIVNDPVKSAAVKRAFMGGG